MKTVTPQALYDNPSDCVIDLRLREDYDSGHLPRARSNCVFEVAFPERLDEVAPRRENRTVIYGSSGASREAELALARMKRLGYRNVVVLDGGIEAWKAGDLPMQGDAPAPVSPEPSDGTYALDLAESSVQWTGRNLLNRHFGFVGIRSGSLELKDGALAGGTIVVDLTDMTCSDLEGEQHDGLIAHLQSVDFFETEVHPTAAFEIRSSERIESATPGSQNLVVRADLTLKGVTAPVELGAIAGVTPDGDLAAQSSFLIDRTVWNVIYGSGRFFPRLGMHLVNDLVDIELKVLARTES